MASAGQSTSQGNQKDVARDALTKQVRSIRTAEDFARFMAALMAALVEGSIEAATANAICKTAATMLKAIEMQFKFGTAKTGGGRILQLTGGADINSLPEAIPDSARPKQTAQRGPWCANCYVKSKQYIKAVEELDGEDLCLPCANRRRKEDDAQRQE